MAVASSKKLWPWLPVEVVEEEILGRLGIEDVMRAKSVCKEWYAVFKDKRFIYKHLELSQENDARRRFIRIHHTSFQIMNPVTLDLLTLPLPSELIVGSELHYCFQCAIHCDGLLLCAFGDGNKERRKLAVWNPVLSSSSSSSSAVKWIEPPLHASYQPSDKYGFGYDNDHNYKVLKFHCYPTSSEYEIYDFKSKLWRVIPGITSDWIVFFKYVSMKGNMYWLAKPRSGRGYSQMFIQSFDFSKETFKPLTCSSNFPVKIEVDLVLGESLDLVVLSSFGGDRLSLLHQHRVGHDDTPRIEVWVTNKVTDAAAAVSWTKYFNVTHPHLPILNPHPYANGIPTYFIHEKTNGGGGGLMLWCDKLLVQEEDKDDVQIMDYDIACPSFYEISEGGEIKNQVDTGPLWYALGRSTFTCGGLYVPSLVPLPE